jgi:hypothetical protein
MGKPIAPHLLCCQGLAVSYYGFALDAADLGHKSSGDYWAVGAGPVRGQEQAIPKNDPAEADWH